MLDEKKSARLEARLPAEIHSLLKKAADLQGRTLSDFVIASAREAAEQAIARNNEIRLTFTEQRRFADPPPAAPTLRKAMKNRERLLDHS